MEELEVCCENCTFFNRCDCSCRAYADYIDDPCNQYCEDFEMEV